jgi:hypothetical protein
MPDDLIQEFGRRRPQQAEPAAPVKRSHHVALLLMGTIAVGGGAYAMMPTENCGPEQPGMAAPSPGSPCSQRQSSSSGGGHGSGGWGSGSSSRANFFGGDAASTPSGGSTADAASGHVARGGFGSFAQAFASHFSGG